MVKNLSIGNNIRDFFSFGFNTAYDNNMTQIVQKFVEESKELYLKILDDNRENPMNEINYEKLLNVCSKSFSELQKMYKLKYDNYSVDPSEYSLNKLKLTTDPIIPGRDSIIHIYSVDGSISVQKNIGNIAYMLLKTYKAYEEHKDGDLINYIKRSARISENDSIIPMSYCIPLIDANINGSISDLYAPGKICISTRLDKDDLYRLLTIELFDNIKYDSNLDLNVTDCRELCRSIFTILYNKMCEPDIISTIFNDLAKVRNFKCNIARSAFGSISKYYDNMSTCGERGFIIKSVKNAVRNTSEMRIHDTNSGKSYTSYTDVAYGSLNKECIFNYTISEILKKRMFDSSVNKIDAIFEFITSNIFLYIISSGSICIGETGSINGLNNLIDEIPEEYLIQDKVIDSISEKYYSYSNDVMNKLITIVYGIFNIKYVYDARRRNKDSTSMSPKEYEFSKFLIGEGFDITFNGLYRIKDIFGGIISSSDDEYYISSGHGSTNDKKRFIDSLNYDEKNINDGNILSRILTIPSLHRICKDLGSIRNNMHDIHDERKLIPNPVHGESPLSLESHTIKGDDSLIGKFKTASDWIFGNLFSKSTENVIDSFIGSCRIGGNIDKFCHDLKKDVVIAVESGDSELITDCIRKTLVLNDLKMKNPSEDNLKLANSTLEAVSEILYK